MGSLVEIEYTLTRITYPRTLRGTTDLRI